MIQKREPGDWVWLSAPPLLQTKQRIQNANEIIIKKEEKIPLVTRL